MDPDDYDFDATQAFGDLDASHHDVPLTSFGPSMDSYQSTTSSAQTSQCKKPLPKEVSLHSSSAQGFHASRIQQDASSVDEAYSSNSSNIPSYKPRDVSGFDNGYPSLIPSNTRGASSIDEAYSSVPEEAFVYNYLALHRSPAPTPDSARIKPMTRDIDRSPPTNSAFLLFAENEERFPFGTQHEKYLRTVTTGKSDHVSKEYCTPSDRPTDHFKNVYGNEELENRYPNGVNVEKSFAISEYFQVYVRELNPNMDPNCDWLVTRIGDQQVNRYLNLLNLQKQHRIAVEAGKCPSTKYCLGLGRMIRYFDDERPITTAQSSVETSPPPIDRYHNTGPSFEESHHWGIPLSPTSKYPAEFECDICFKVKRFEAPSDRIKHIFEDLQLFTCTHATCPDSKPFKRKADWIRHENERHRRLEWWTCQVDKCGHTCYRKDNFVQHLVREHMMPLLNCKSKDAGPQIPDTSNSTSIMIDNCYRQTTDRPLDEPCKFCGETFSSWKKLTSHLAKHMENIASPVLRLVAEDAEKDTMTANNSLNSNEDYRPFLSKATSSGTVVPASHGLPQEKTDHLPLQSPPRFEEQALLTLPSPLPPFSSISLINSNSQDMQAKTLGLGSHVTRVKAELAKCHKPVPEFEVVTDDSPCRLIRNWVLAKLPRLRSLTTGTKLLTSNTLWDTRYNTHERMSTTFDMLWDIRRFMREQYGTLNDSVGNVITISGTALHAQASTCREYVQSHWPLHGLQVVNAVQTALDTLKGKASSSLQDPQICITFKKSVVIAKINGSSAAIIEIIQILTWMGAALRTSTKESLEYSVIVPDSDDSKNGFHMDIITRSLEDQSCWYPLFVNPVIAKGFPTAPRKHNEIGLELPIEMMAALGGVRHAVDFKGGLLLKGLFSMFVPIRRYERSIQWHLVQNAGKHRLAYSEVKIQCPTRALLDEVDHEALQNTRAFLGWWRTSKTCLGADCYDYAATTYSSAMPAMSGTATSSALGFSKIQFSSPQMSIGAKDSKLFLSRAGPLQQVMEWAEMMPVLLYDVSDRRGWFVRASDVILHVIRTRHAKRPFCIDGAPVRLAGTNPGVDGDRAAERIIMEMASTKLIQDNTNRASDYYLSDLVQDIWGLLEGLSEMQNMGELDGIASTPVVNLQGWEFMALVDRKSPIRRKGVDLQCSTGGWDNLVKEVDAVVLFAHGFGDIIQPMSMPAEICPRWKTLPRHKDHVAAGVPLLKRLCEEAGSSAPYAHLTPSKLQWHKPSLLFEDCRMNGNIGVDGSCTCERLQQIILESESDAKIVPPGVLEETGCVIFGMPEFMDDSCLANSRETVFDSLFDEIDGHKDYALPHHTKMYINVKAGCAADNFLLSPTKVDVPICAKVALDTPSRERTLVDDYRYGGGYGSRHFENFNSTLIIENESKLSCESSLEEDNEVKNMPDATSNCFENSSSFREKGMSLLKDRSSQRHVIETARTRPVPKNGRSLPVNDSLRKLDATPEVENHKERQFVRIVKTSCESESMVHHQWIEQ